MSGLMQKLGMEENEAIEHPWVSRAIENAQRKVEGHNFDIRKQVLEFDDVANDQRKVVYEQRNELMAAKDVSSTIVSMRATVVDNMISIYIAPGSIDEQWNIAGLSPALKEEFGLDVDIESWLEEDKDLHEETLRERIVTEIQNQADAKEAITGSELMRHFEKAITLQTLDSQWKEHLAQMDYLRQGINLRGYAQKDPKQEFKREAFNMFTSMLERIKHDVVSLIARVELRAEEDVKAVEERRRQTGDIELQHDQVDVMTGEAEGQNHNIKEQSQPIEREGRKVGRNERCPCGSGKKFKQCHGALN
jgi:preprotein translocase subunit SecA